MRAGWRAACWWERAPGLWGGPSGRSMRYCVIAPLAIRVPAAALRMTIQQLVIGFSFVFIALF